MASWCGGLSDAASGGDANARFEIGARFSDGRGVKADPAEASRWYRLAADRGLPPAQYRLGNMLEKGTGVVRNLDEALSYYRLAAEAGNSSAMHNLAVLYASGVTGKPDYAALDPATKHKPIDYPRPDGVLTFDRLTNLSFSATNHEEDQPVHLKVADPELQKRSEHDVYAGPSNRYCPAGVYEWVEEGGQPRFVINAQNCVHCKTCDIKDPNQNINWTVPEGGGGPNYSGM